MEEESAPRSAARSGEGRHACGFTMGSPGVNNREVRLVGEGTTVGEISEGNAMSCAKDGSVVGSAVGSFLPADAFFVAGRTEDNGPFDWPVVMEALEKKGYVTELAPTWTVEIPWLFIINQIINKLRLPLHRAGYIDDRKAMGFGRAWVVLDVPLTAGGLLMKRKTFISDPAPCRFLAMDDVARAIVMYLRKKGLIVVKDANYRDMHVAEERARSAEHLCGVYSAMRHEGRTGGEVSHERGGRLVGRVKALCKDFSDMLAVTVAENGRGTDGSCSSGTVAYIGREPPATRLEMLSMSLVSLLDEEASGGAAETNTE